DEIDEVWITASSVAIQIGRRVAGTLGHGATCVTGFRTRPTRCPTEGVDQGYAVAGRFADPIVEIAPVVDTLGGVDLTPGYVGIPQTHAGDRHGWPGSSEKDPVVSGHAEKC